jgi:intracellular septation protein
MKMLFDFLPILLFFIAYKFYDIYVATAVAMAASLVQTLWHRYATGKFEKMHVITLLLIMVLGGLTLVLQDEAFIKWKPTLVNWLFAGVFLGSFFIGEKTIIQRMLDSQVGLPENAWRNLNWAWVFFFVLSGALNLYVAYNYDTETWVNFKLFGLLGLTVFFILLQTLYLASYFEKDTPIDEEDAQKNNHSKEM